MGRADLSRHRASSLSDTPPIAFPSKLHWITAELAKHSNSSVKSAILTFRNASTQRDQVQALKLIGIALKEAHVSQSSQRNLQPMCHCIQNGQSDQHSLRPLCVLVAPLLCATLFETPIATYGLRGAALRAILLCREARVQGFEKPVLNFLSRLEKWKNVNIDSEDQYNALLDGRSPSFLQDAADVTSLSTILAEHQSRAWVLDCPFRITSALRLISVAPNLYCHTFDKIQAYGNGNQPTEGGRQIEWNVNMSVLEAACDASVKAAQDVITCLIKKKEDSAPELARVELGSVELIVRSCSALLELPVVPRYCAMASAVAYVSGLLFQLSKDQSPEALAEVLRENVMSLAVDFAPFSQLSLFRAIMEAPAAKPALPFVLYPPDDSDSTLYLFDLLVSLAKNSLDVHLRFFALDTLIVCVRRRHPAKLSTRCRDVVLKLISERLQEPVAGINAQVKSAMEALVAVDGNDEESTSFWIAKAAILLQGDWLSRGIYAPLGILVGRIGALQILEAKPECQSLAMEAAGIDARLAKPASDWLMSFWKSLRAECCGDYSRFYDVTVDPLIRSLVHEENKTLRERAAEYMLPAFFRAHERGDSADCVHSLLRKVMQTTKHDSTLQIRGTIAVLSTARTFGAFTTSFTDEKVREMVDNGLSSSSEDIRSAALDLVVTSKTPTAPVSMEELDMISLHLPVALMPGGSAGYRSRFRHSMRRLFERLAKCRHAALQGSGGWWTRERKEKYKGERVDALEGLRSKLIRRIESFEIYCSQLIISSSYPGASFARSTNALEIAKLLSLNTGFRTPFGIETPCPRSYVAGLMGCLLDEWERPRQAALQIVSSLGDPVPGLDNLRSVSELQKFAMPLLLSPRRKEVDSGASICRCIFLKCVLKAPMACFSSRDTGTQNPVILFNRNLEKQDANRVMNESPGLAYAESVLDSLERIVETAKENFIHSCRFGLFHGHCLLLRYIIQDLRWRTLPSPSKLEHFRKFVKRFIALYQACITIALKGVGFQSLEEDFISSPDSVDEELDESVNVLLQEPKQLVRTSSFLSLKEICVSLGILCHEVPIDADVNLDPGMRGLITVDELQLIVNIFLSVFVGTRHWGVIDGASEGLQLLCEKLLQESSNTSRNLPRELIVRTLSMTLRGDLYVLRRSAGIPHLICAIVNAEAVIAKRSYDSPLLDNVMKTLLGHLERNHMFTEDSHLEEKRSRGEESVAHALNVLRSLFLNGNVASTILNYLESTTIYCIRAFCSASWLIRNSALMLFSALVRRSVGVCLERKSKVSLSSFEVATGTSATLDGERRLNGVTACQFFARYPNLYSFLLKQLTSSTNLRDQGDSGSHPSLFPTLYLLSSLSPSAVEDPTSSLSMAPFRDILRECLHWRSNYVRRAAAAASVPLIGNIGRVAEVIEGYLITGISAEVQRPLVPHEANCNLSVDTCEPKFLKNVVPYCLRQNHLHGDLLAINAILTGTCRAMGSSDKIETIKRMACSLPQRTWVATDTSRNPCSVTRAGMISILCKVYEMSREVQLMDRLSEQEKQCCQSLINMCHNVIHSIYPLKLKERVPGAEVGLSSFVGCVAQFLVLVTVSSFERHELSFDEALLRLQPLIFCDSREELGEGLKSIRLLCERAGEAEKKQKKSICSPECIGRLVSIWIKGINILNSVGHQDIIVATLRLLNVLLRYFNSHSVQLQVEKQLVDVGMASSILDIVELHSCVDVRESGIILLAQFMSAQKQTEQLILRWILFVEHMTSLQQPPTSRLAACVSLDQSGLGYRCWKDKDNFEAEVTVRGFLCLARMVEDDSIEVRSTALDVLHRCLRESPKKLHYEKDNLPTLMCLFENIGIRFSQTDALFCYLHDLLSDGEGSQQHGVMAEVQKVVQTRLLTRVGDGPPCSNKCSKTPDVTRFGRKQGTGLFKLEEDTDGGELVVRMQLIAWCYRNIIMQEHSQRKSASSVLELCISLCKSLESEAVEGLRKAGDSVLNGAVFTANGFVRCYKSVLRLFLGVSILQVSNWIDKIEKQKVTAWIITSLMQMNKKFGEILHPVLCFAIDGVHELLARNDEEGRRNALQKVLFLLQV